MTKKILGYWFYGHSGVGKTFAAKYLRKKIIKSLSVDGDEIRKNISKDLDYNIKDRIIQIQRTIGICKIIINNNYFPIVSSGYMNSKSLNLIKKNNILVFKIERDSKFAMKNNPIYKLKKNIIGKDIKIKKLNTQIIFNSGDKKFINELKKLII
tara:strand:- start:33 stop:494 length:462 start_codon:yes stop_codon:yes gene_type:complete